jgi:hypothetical protein
MVYGICILPYGMVNDIQILINNNKNNNDDDDNNNNNTNNSTRYTIIRCVRRTQEFTVPAVQTTGDTAIRLRLEREPVLCRSQLPRACARASSLHNSTDKVTNQLHLITVHPDLVA